MRFEFHSKGFEGSEMGVRSAGMLGREERSGSVPMPVEAWDYKLLALGAEGKNPPCSLFERKANILLIDLRDNQSREGR